jgi:hypothetical protein
MKLLNISPAGMAILIAAVCAFSIGSLIAATGTSDSTIRSHNGHDIAGAATNRPRT